MKKLGIGLLFLVFLSGMGLFFDSKATAVGYCDTGGFGRRGCEGFFTGVQTSASGTINNLIYAGIHSTNANSFIATLKGYLNGSNEHDKMGAAMAINAMMGKGPFNTRDAGYTSARNNLAEWEELVKDYANTDKPSQYGVRWNVTRDPGRNSAYFGNINDDAVHTDTHGPVAVIEFYWNGGAKTFQLERACSNLVGSMTPLEKQDTWKLKGGGKVNNTEVGPGEVAKFDHRIKVLSGNTRATYGWKVTGEYRPKGGNPNGFTNNHGGNLPNDTANNVAVGDLRPDFGGAADFSYTFPSNAQTGDKYCQRIEYNNANGPGSGWSNSTAVCTSFTRDWRLTAASSPTTCVVLGPGQSTTFRHTVTNKGPSTATYSWELQGKASYGGASSWSQNNKGGSSNPALSDSSGNINVAKNVSRPGNLGYTFKFPSNARNGDTYYQRVRATNATGPGTGAIGSTPACAKFSSSPTVNTYTVSVSPSASAPANSEVGDAVTMQSFVTVSNFPSMGYWGYNNDAVALAAVRVTATNDIGGYLEVDWRNVCPAGADSSYASSSSSCTETLWKPAQKNADGNWACNMYPNFTGTTRGSGSNKDCKIHRNVAAASFQYRSKCAQTNAWTGWSGSIPTCKDHYTCPGGASGSGWYTSAPTCNGWKCRYPDATQVNQASAPTCEKRCEGAGGVVGTGDRPPYPGSLHCFKAPSFQIKCTWESGSVTTITVSSAGTHACGNTTANTNNIGDRLCYTVTPTQVGTWSSPPPGWRINFAHDVWLVDIAPDDAEACTDFTGRPYIKVYGGDVRVGGGIGRTESTCPINNAAQIKTYARAATPNYIGSGSQYAAFAPDFIDQFVSGQYNYRSPILPNPSPAPGNVPKPLSFANNNGSAYGGYFGASAPACIGAVQKLPSSVEEETGPVEIFGEALSGDYNEVIRHVKGNVYIGGDITYDDAATGWATAASIPLYQLVVEGNIYIGANVSRLDGFFVAIADTVGNGGNIYTCANPDMTVPATTFDDCTTQLVVNGGLAAKRINFLRDCGTTKQSTTSEGTAYSGGADQQTCSPGNHAAEIINYTPETWLRGVRGKSSANFDSISSMPPIL